MAKVDVNSGICGFKTMIEVYASNIHIAIIEIETQCPNIKPMEQELKEVNALKECFSQDGDSRVRELSKKYCKHLSCPVPVAILKGIEVACGFALPCDVEIKITK